MYPRLLLLLLETRRGIPTSVVSHRTADSLEVHDRLKSLHISVSNSGSVHVREGLCLCLCLCLYTVSPPQAPGFRREAEFDVWACSTLAVGPLKSLVVLLWRQSGVL